MLARGPIWDTKFGTWRVAWPDDFDFFLLQACFAFARMNSATSDLPVLLAATEITRSA